MSCIAESSIKASVWVKESSTGPEAMTERMDKAHSVSCALHPITKPSASLGETVGGEIEDLPAHLKQ